VVAGSRNGVLGKELRKDGEGTNYDKRTVFGATGRVRLGVKALAIISISSVIGRARSTNRPEAKLMSVAMSSSRTRARPLHGSVSSRAFWLCALPRPASHPELDGDRRHRPRHKASTPTASVGQGR